MAGLLFQSFFLFAFISSIQASEVPLGVHPSNAPFYVINKPFTCLDKSATIPWDKVNDDYCDCLDGSDEPGTSACPDMKFYCANEGHEGVFIHSGYVNDMVCDCCDGSDEYNGRIKCNNTCGSLAREREEKIQKKRKDFEAGHQIYNEYVTKKAIELEELAKQREEKELRGIEDEENSKYVPKDAETTVTVPGNTPELSIEPPHAETPMEPEVIVYPGEEKKEIDDEKHDSSDSEYSSEASDHLSDETYHPPESESITTPEPKPIDYGPDNGFMMLTDLPDGCLEYTDKQYTYSLCAFKEVRQRNRGAPAGSGTILGTWKEWVGHPEDSVHWTKEQKLDKLPYNEMLYDRGEHCWNGPSRSTKVRVVCGAENQILSVDEPSRCTYVIDLETPAACHHKPEKLLLMHVEL